jgi:hypothetical protein
MAAGTISARNVTWYQAGMSSHTPAWTAMPVTSSSTAMARTAARARGRAIAAAIRPAASEQTRLRTITPTSGPAAV